MTKPKVEVDKTLEQEFKAGDCVLVYDSRFNGEPRLGYIEVLQQDGSVAIVRFEDKNTLQVSTIQCFKAKKKLPRVAWVHEKTRELVFKDPKSSEYVKFREVFD